MAEYFEHHAHADLDAYVELAVAAKASGLPVVVGLEVDFYRGRMDRVADLLAGYPFDVLLGSVHWIGAWRFDHLDDPVSMAQWSARDVDRCWDDYTAAVEELAATATCDVLAHPDLIKAAGRRPEHPERVVGPAGRGGGQLRDGGRAVLGRVAHPGRRAVPGRPTAGPLGGRRGALDHGVGRPPAGSGGRPGRRPPVPARGPRGVQPAGLHGAAAPTGPGGRPGPRAQEAPMATPAELAAEYTDLDADELEHLQRLLGSWSVLADLSFSDLVLMVPMTRIEEPGRPLVVLGQMRPNNRPTLVEQDLVGQTYGGSSGPCRCAAISRSRCSPTGSTTRCWASRCRSRACPCDSGRKVIGVLLRVSLGPLRGPTSLYEKTYLDLFDRLAAMVAESAFPFPDEDVGTEESPRVGDGVVVVDAEGRVEFASPNALNAFHRMGVYSPPEGRRFSDLGVEESAAEWALATGRPVVEEVERRPDVIVLLHCIPLLSHGVVTGAMILIRDVTDVRRLDRLLLSKDAAIREVHHRVKNNLQTISSLLSLQARRVDEGAARVALREAERRVRSIALVHEILSREPGDQVPFDDIITSLIQMAEDSVVSGQTIEITVHGDLGDVSAEVATPLAVILAEVLQNAVEHAFEDDGGPTDVIGHVSVNLVHTGGGAAGRGAGRRPRPARGFSIRETRSLGLSIVRDLVVSQLGGSIDMAPVAEADGGGTRVVIETPDRVARN